MSTTAAKLFATGERRRSRRIFWDRALALELHGVKLRAFAVFGTSGWAGLSTGHGDANTNKLWVRR